MCLWVSHSPKLRNVTCTFQSVSGKPAISQIHPFSWLDLCFHSLSWPQCIMGHFIMKWSSCRGVFVRDNISYWIWFCSCFLHNPSRATKRRRRTAVVITTRNLTPLQWARTKEPGTSMMDFVIRDCLADRANRPVDFGRETVSDWIALARFMPAIHT